MTVIVSNHEHHLSINAVDTNNSIDHIPAMVYRPHVGVRGLQMIKDRPKFDLPKKIFGETEEQVQAMWEDFQETEGTLGAILIGEKGSGKSMTSERMANQFISAGYPVLLVDSAWPSQVIKDCIAVCGPCMVFFDEFGKVFNEDARQALLTLFSDSSLKKVMFVVTANKREELDEFLIDRPGRFKYHLRFGHVDKEAIDELADHLDIQGKVRVMLHEYCAINQIPFDILRFIAAEAKKCVDPDKFRKRLKMLNVPPYPYVRFKLEEIWINAEPFYGRVNFTQEGDEFVLEATDLSGTSIIYEVFDWETVNKHKHYSHRSREDYLVQLTPDVKLGIERSLVGHKPESTTFHSILLEKPKPAPKEEAEPSDEMPTNVQALGRSYRPDPTLTEKCLTETGRSTLNNPTAFGRVIDPLQFGTPVDHSYVKDNRQY